MLKDFPKTIRNNLQYIPFYDERSTFNLTNKGLHRGCYSVNLWNFSGHLWTNAFVSGISIKSQNTPTNLPTFSLCKIFASQSSILMSNTWAILWFLFSFTWCNGKIFFSMSLPCSKNYSILKKVVGKCQINRKRRECKPFTWYKIYFI